MEAGLFGRCSTFPMLAVTSDTVSSVSGFNLVIRANIATVCMLRP